MGRSPGSSSDTTKHFPVKKSSVQLLWMSTPWTCTGSTTQATHLHALEQQGPVSRRNSQWLLDRILCDQSQHQQHAKYSHLTEQSAATIRGMHQNGHIWRLNSANLHRGVCNSTRSHRGQTNKRSDIGTSCCGWLLGALRCGCVFNIMLHLVGGRWWWCEYRLECLWASQGTALHRKHK